jgi:hypothetical protein
MNNNYEVKHCTVEDHNKYVNKSSVGTVITFRTQQLLDLWENEFSGQVSDGMWENSRNTEWLWRNTWLRLGDETKVEVENRWRIGRKRFGMVKELWDVVGDRIIGENGFADEKEAKKAWKEIADAIYNADVTTECVQLCSQLKKEWYDTDKAEKAEMLTEFKDVCDSIDEFGRGKVGKDITVRVCTNPGRFEVSVGYGIACRDFLNKYVERGNLKAYIEKCQNFIEAYNKLEAEFKENTSELLYKRK